MYKCNSIHIYLIILLQGTQILVPVLAKESTLVLVNVLFRHGDRTTDASTVYPKDPYINETYYPYGLGELTNKGKQTAYNVGKELRARYDQFLGKIYTPAVLEANTSPFSRTKASLQVVLAGLFPPVKELLWEPALKWQPIPFSALPENQDPMFLGAQVCPNFQKRFSEAAKSPKMLDEVKKHRKTFDYITANTGKIVQNYWDVFSIYMCIKTEEEWGLPPPNWSKTLYPEVLKNFTILGYDLLTSTTELRRITAGYLLKKIVQDSKAKVNGAPGTKIFLYSGHELNIAHVLHTLDLFEPHIPPYGAYILFELHKIGRVFGFKIFYQDYSKPVPKLMKLPACQEFCPLDQFVALVEEYFFRNHTCGRSFP